MSGSQSGLRGQGLGLELESAAHNGRFSPSLTSAADGQAMSIGRSVGRFRGQVSAGKVMIFASALLVHC